MVRIGIGVVLFGVLMAFYFVGQGPTGAGATLQQVRLAAVEHSAEVKNAMRASAVYCLQKLTDNRSPAILDDMTGDSYSAMVDVEGFSGDKRFDMDILTRVRVLMQQKYAKRFAELQMDSGNPVTKRVIATNEIIEKSGQSMFNCSIEETHKKLLRSGIIAGKT